MARLIAIMWIFVQMAFVVWAAGCAGSGGAEGKTLKPWPADEAAPSDASTSAADSETRGDPGPDDDPDASSDPDGPEGSTGADGSDQSVLTGTVLAGPKAKLQDLFPGCKVEKKIAVPKNGPYEDVMIVTSTWPSPAPGDQLNTSYHLAIRTSEGWFIMQYLGTSGTNCGGESLFFTSFILETFEMRDILPGDPPEIVLTYKESADDIKDEKLLICGIGPSKKPSCIGPMTPARSDPAGAYKSWESEVVFKPDGKLEFKSGQDTVTTFTIIFP